MAVDLNRERMETRLRVISERRDPNAAVSTLKRFIVRTDEDASDNEPVTQLARTAAEAEG